MELSEEEKTNLLREEIERRFFEELQENPDVARDYMVYPVDLLSEKLRIYLDEFLILEAINLFDDKDYTAPLIVYRDEQQDIILDTPQRKLDVLKRMLSYTVKREMFELSHRIVNYIKALQ